MRVIAIFEKIGDRVFAARFDIEKDDELDKAFDLWHDREFLRSFFMKYRGDLTRFDPSIRVKETVSLVPLDAKRLFDKLVKSARSDDLDDLFQPLDNREEQEIRYEFQKLKARGPGRKSMLRLYAVKYSGIYIISGSAIKLTEKMERPHLRAELHKLELLKQFLRGDEAEPTFVYLEI